MKFWSTMVQIHQKFFVPHFPPLPLPPVPPFMDHVGLSVGENASLNENNPTYSSISRYLLIDISRERYKSPGTICRLKIFTHARCSHLTIFRLVERRCSPALAFPNQRLSPRTVSTIRPTQTINTPSFVPFSCSNCKNKK